MPIKTLPNVIIGSGASKNITNNIFISDFGNTIITGYLTVDYYLTVDGALNVGGQFNLLGDLIVKDGASNTVFSVDSATGDTIVAGNFTVNGTTTTIDTTTLVVEDPVLTLAKNASGSPTASTDTGLFLQRGSTENPAIFIWNETSNQFELATVTGASSTTTNFSGGGIVKTYATFKAGDMYGSSLDVTNQVISSSVSTSVVSIGEHFFDINGLFFGEYGNLNIHSDQSSSSIVLNWNVTSGTPTTNAVIEVKRGASTSALITWDEDNEAWDFTESLSVSGFSLTPYYIYVRYTNVSLTNGQDFYIFSSKDNGVTREILPIYSLDSIEESNVAKYYQATGAVTYSNTNPPTVNGVVYLESGKSYYIAVSSNAACVSLNEFQFYISSTVLGSAPTYTGLILVNASPTSEFTYLLTIDSTNWSANKVRDVRGAVITGTLLAGSSFPYLSTLRLNNSLNHDVDILLNSDESGSGSDAKIEVERGSSTNSYIQWDDTNNSWNFNFPITVNADMNGPSNRIYGNTYIETTATNKALYVMTSSSSADTIMIASKGSIQINSDDGILLNSEQYSGIPTRDTKIEVARGSSTNSIILWNETNDRWDFNFGLYLNTDSQLKFEKFTVSTTPAILLNADETGVASSDVIALEVERGSSTNSYLKWDETNDRWDFNFGFYLNTDSQLKFEKFTTGTTPAILLNADETGVASSDVIAIEVERGLSTNSYIKWDETNDFWEFSNTLLLKSPSIIKMEKNAFLTAIGAILLNSDEVASPTDTVIAIQIERGTSTNSNIKWDETNDRWDFNFGFYLNTDSQLKFEKFTTSTTPAILLNADRTSSGNEADVRVLEVERGLLTNSYIQWDEDNDRWDFNFGFYLNTDSQVKFEKFTTSTTPAILLNADRTSSGQEADVRAIEVERGLLTNSYIQWDEDNDRWDFNFGLNITSGDILLNTDGQLKFEKFTTSTTPAILLNADRTSSGNEADVRAIEVERGLLTNSYIGWEEDYDRWELSQPLKIKTQDNIYYLFAEYPAGSRTRNEYFYIFSSSDNGVTRKVIYLDLQYAPFAFEQDTSLGYPRYIARTTDAYSPTIFQAQALIHLNSHLEDPNEEYYLNIVTDTTGGAGYDFKMYIGTTEYAPVLSDDILNNALIYNYTYKLSDVIAQTGTWTSYTSSISPATSIYEVPNGMPAIYIEPNKDQSAKAIEVIRTAGTNSTIEWDEGYQTWKISHGLMSYLKISTITFTANTQTKPLVLGYNLYHVTGNYTSCVITIADAINEGTVIHIKNVTGQTITVEPAQCGEGNDYSVVNNRTVSLYYYDSQWWLLSSSGTITIN
jgi:hypothetical protein